MNVDSEQLIGASVICSDSRSAGIVEQVFRDEVDGTPRWARIRSRRDQYFVPLAGSSMTSDGLSVPFDTQKIVKEPELDVDRYMSADQEGELSDYFGLTIPAQPGSPETGQMEPTRTEPAQTEPVQAEPAQKEPGMAPAGQTQSDQALGGGEKGEDWLVCAEERVTVSTQTAESGRVRLHKYVDTESFEQPVRVYHEEYEIQRAPITPEDRADGSFAESEQEIILHEERAVIGKEAVPVERVRLSAKKVMEDKMIRTDVRKERIEVEPVSSGTIPRSAEFSDDSMSRRPDMGQSLSP